jgi:hypothetical protein
MRRLALALAALALAAGISACGGGGGSNASGGSGGGCTWAGDGQTYAHDAGWGDCADMANVIGPTGTTLSPMKQPPNPGSLVCTYKMVAGADPIQIWGSGNAAEANTRCQGTYDNPNTYGFTWAAGFGPSAAQPDAPSPTPLPTPVWVGTYAQGYAAGQFEAENDTDALDLPFVYPPGSEVAAYCAGQDTPDRSALNTYEYSGGSSAVISNAPWVQGCVAAIHQIQPTWR